MSYNQNVEKPECINIRMSRHQNAVTSECHKHQNAITLAFLDIKMSEHRSQVFRRQNIIKPERQKVSTLQRQNDRT
jgi:hypothetical protein